MKKFSDMLKYTERVKLRVVREGAYRDGDVIGVHQYNRNWIKQLITPDMKMGNYRVGLIVDGVFNVCYVGRTTDQTLQERLLQHTDPEDDHYFDDNFYFDFNVAKTEEEAIERECIDYHSFGESSEAVEDGWLDNEIHPSLPKGEHCPWKDCNHVGQ